MVEVHQVRQALRPGRDKYASGDAAQGGQRYSARRNAFVAGARALRPAVSPWCRSRSALLEELRVAPMAGVIEPVGSGRPRPTRLASPAGRPGRGRGDAPTPDWRLPRLSFSRESLAPAVHRAGTSGQFWRHHRLRVLRARGEATGIGGSRGAATPADSSLRGAARPAWRAPNPAAPAPHRPAGVHAGLGCARSMVAPSSSLPFGADAPRLKLPAQPSAAARPSLSRPVISTARRRFGGGTAGWIAARRR